MEKISAKNIRVRHIDEDIEIEGIIDKMGRVETRVNQTKHECPKCGTIISMRQIFERLREPKICSCRNKNGFKMISKDMIDLQKIHLRDLPVVKGVSYGVNIILTGELTISNKKETIQEGDKIIVFGKVEAIPLGVTSTEHRFSIRASKIEKI